MLVFSRRLSAPMAAAQCVALMGKKPALRHRNLSTLFTPDSEATVSALADAYVSLPAVQLAQLHAAISAKLKVDHETAILAQMGGGGGGAMMAAPSAAQATAAGASSASASDAAPPAAADGKAAGEKKKVEKNTFDVKLSKYPAEAKIKLIKELRTVTNLPLKDAKDAIDKAPGLIQTNMGKEDAEKLKALFVGLGAEVELL